jgi:crotonobetainyl-CoA:carnitine CoA-transferase CaiB-like acyl-CoA transferase
MALLDTQVAVLGNQALNWMVSGNVPQRMGNGHANLVPYQSFACADGDLIIAVGNDRQFARLCAVLNRDSLASDPRFATNPGRVVNREILVPLIAEAAAGWTAAALLAALEANGIPAGPVNRIDQVFADPQVIARTMQLRTSDRGGELPGLAAPIVLDGTRMSAVKSSPSLGEDTGAGWRLR